MDSTGKLGQVYELLDRFIAEGQVNAAAVAVGWKGEQVGEYQAGSSREGIAASAETIWPLASISKVYTAAMVMALVERGLLTLSMPVHLVLPELSGDGKEAITFRHLLTHTSGLVYESPEMEQRLIDQTSINGLIAEVYTYPLQFEPGTRHAYSDYNYLLAGHAASVVAGTPFPDLVREHVIEPGGLADTWMPPSDAVEPRLARVVGPLAEGTSGDMYNSPYGLGLAHPAFGTCATVSDLMRFGLLFAPSGERRILSDASIRTMTTDQTGGGTPGSFPGMGGDKAMPWGIGFDVKGERGIGGDITSNRTFGHGGATGCILRVDPEDDIVIAYVSNKHARTGRFPFTRRQVSIVNAVTAALTRRS